MRANFNFNRCVSFESSLEVDDIFNACLETDTGHALSFMMTKTVCGKTFVMEFGPIDETADEFRLSFETMKSSDKAVKAKIAKFLGAKGVVDATAISEEDALASIPDIRSLWPKGNDEGGEGDEGEH